MKLEARSKNLLAITKSKAKMYEFSVSEEHHIALTQDPKKLLLFTIGILGELCAYESRVHKNNTEYRDLLKSQLVYVAQYFDALNLSRLEPELSSYLKLIGAATYYLAEMPGSSSVLSKELDYEIEHLTDSYLEGILVWILKSDLSQTWYYVENSFVLEEINTFVRAYAGFYAFENDANALYLATLKLKNKIYEFGSDRELLFSDILTALVNRKIENASINCLPKYTGISLNGWASTLNKDGFIKEFWPAQKLLGEQGVFSGVSAVVQMPTSAGKTKSTELIIRSAFLMGRAKVAIVIAPFRALCREISSSFEKAFENEPVNINELKDVTHVDEEETDFLRFLLGEKFKESYEHSIIISTPEKLVYLLRHEPHLAAEIGLLIFDEGHQFDTGKRGVTYELLIAFLKNTVKENCQKVLISAVMANAASIGDWLNGESGIQVQGSQCIPAVRSIAFTSWQSPLGQLQYLDQENSMQQGFYVPRVIEQINLGTKGRERKDRIFPEKNDTVSLSAYLGVKLCSQGPVAIFCGVKSTVATISDLLVDYFKRGLKIPAPSENSDQAELNKISNLANLHFGNRSVFVESIKLGVLPHSSNIPNGLRMAVEWAMENNKGIFVVCTSTLAQGVNLPIRYLVVSATFQAGKEISTRDFHNLIGRAGRSGYHTEGSIIFADHNIFDKKQDYYESWRWTQANHLLNFMNAEECMSSLKDIIAPITSEIFPIDTIDYISNPAYHFAECIKVYIEKELDVEPLLAQLKYKNLLIQSVESYFLSYLKDVGSADKKDFVALAAQTLAYHLSNPEERIILLRTFEVIADRVMQIESTKYSHYGKSLLGIEQLLFIEKWIQENRFELELSTSVEDLLTACWTLITNLSDHKSFKNIHPEHRQIEVATQWIAGASYHDLLIFMENNGFQTVAKTQIRKINLDQIIDFTDDALGFDGMLFLGALADILEGNGFSEDLISMTRDLQSRIKFGLSNNLELWLYHKGFSDREVCKRLSLRLNAEGVDSNKFNYDVLKQYNTQIQEELADLPACFTVISEAES